MGSETRDKTFSLLCHSFEFKKQNRNADILHWQVCGFHVARPNQFHRHEVHNTEGPLASSHVSSAQLSVYLGIGLGYTGRTQMYVQRNIEVRSCNHCRRGKAITNSMEHSP